MSDEQPQTPKSRLTIKPRDSKDAYKRLYPHDPHDPEQDLEDRLIAEVDAFKMKRNRAKTRAKLKG